jgi:hypothetical protein
MYQCTIVLPSENAKYACLHFLLQIQILSQSVGQANACDFNSTDFLCHAMLALLGAIKCRQTGMDSW